MRYAQFPVFFNPFKSPSPHRLSPLNPHSQPRAHSARRAVWRLKGAARYLIWEMHTWKRNIAKRRKKLRNIKWLQIAYNSMRRIETKLGRSNAFERKVKIKHNLEDFFRKLFKGENFLRADARLGGRLRNAGEAATAAQRTRIKIVEKKKIFSSRAQSLQNQILPRINAASIPQAAFRQ